VKVPTIIVTGPVGVGKSTVAEAMGYLLLAAKVPHANVDFDQLTAGPRTADDDVWGTKLGLSNLAAIWKNYQLAGARRLIIARVIESRSELDGFRHAVPGADIVLVRLRAAPGTPVRAAGDGTVVFAGKVAYSRHIVVRHENGAIRRDHRVDRHRAPRRNVARDQTSARQQDEHKTVNGEIVRAHPVEQAPHPARQRQRA